MKTVNLSYSPADENLDCNPEPCVMALGFFDGIHRGHRKIIETAGKIAREKNLKLAVMTFSPHPSQVIPGNKKIVNYLTPLPAKEKLFRDLGVEILYVVNFNKDFSRLSHDGFTKLFLEGLKCRHAVAGFDFQFGFKGLGNMEWLTSAGKNKFAVTTVTKLTERDIKISSTHIRHLLDSGKVDSIPAFLGRQYETSGIIVKKAFKGAKGKCRLVSIEAAEECYLPADGYYLTEINDGKRLYKGICNTSGGNVLEILLFEFARFEAEEVTVKWLEKQTGSYSEQVKQDLHDYKAKREATRVI